MNHNIRRSTLQFLAAIVLWSSCKTAGGEEQQTQFDRDLSKKEVIGFVYHRFGDNRYPSTNTETDVFKKHLQYLKDSSYKVMTMGQALTYLRSPEEPYYSKVAVITVDDGFKSFLTGGVPLLRKFGYKASLFVNTETIGGGSYLNWKELEQLVNEGIEIGNHSHAHPYFLNTPAPKRYEYFKEDLEISRKLFRRYLNMDPDLYVYPYGEFDLGMQEVLKSEDYRAAFAQNSGVIYNGSDSFALPRFPVAGTFGRIDRFVEKARMKALRITETEPGAHVLRGPDMPELRLTIDGGQPVSLNEIQCFVAGSKIPILIEKKDYANVIHVYPDKSISSGRFLYTITAPSPDHSNWYWYSFPWFCPECR